MTLELKCIDENSRSIARVMFVDNALFEFLSTTYSICNGMKKENRVLSIAIVYAFLVSGLLLYFFAMRPSAESVFASIGIITWAVIVTGIFFDAEDEREPKKEEIMQGTERECKRKEALKELYKKHPDLFKLVYEQISAGIRSRDNMTIVAGSIMITASLLLLGTLVQVQSTLDYEMRVSMIATIMAVYSIWFVCFNLTSGRLNRLQYEHLTNMEDAKHFRLHRLMREQVWDKKLKWFNYSRRPGWLYFFYVLTVACTIVLLI